MLGAFAGYVGGIVGEAIMRVVDVLYAFPTVVFVIVIIAMFDLGGSLFWLFALIGVVTVTILLWRAFGPGSQPAPPRVIAPDDDEYDAARALRFAGFDRHPGAVVRAADARDVIRTVTFARDQGIPLAVRGGVAVVPRVRRGHRGGRDPVLVPAVVALVRP